ncbi:3-oxoadipate enol-lactonase [Paraburkholderia caballeronis]|nr:3-oxoadipate enol-lactonase [Paraburkholderia caballeronis]
MAHEMQRQRTDWRRGAPFDVRCGDGATIRCRIDGVPGAPWVLFSNSHATNLSMWDEQVRALEDRFSILRYDQRGHGGSAVTPDVTFDRLAEDVVDICDAVSIDRATLVGVSMGAVTVLRVAARFPQRVVRVVACDGQWKAPAGAREAWENRIAAARTTGMTPLAAATVARWFPAQSSRAAASRIAAVEAMIRATSVDGYAYCAMAMQAYDFSGDYPRLALPVHFVVGACDGALPATMLDMHAATPGSTYDVIPEAGHLPPVDRPETINALLARYLGSGEAADGDTER